MSSKQFYLRIDSGKNEGVWPVKVLGVIQTKGKGIRCPSCKRVARAVMDLIQWGFWDDHYTSFFVCKTCGIAYQFGYDVAPEKVSVLAPDSFDS